MNLIQKAASICREKEIDIEELTHAYWVYSSIFKEKKDLIGIVLRYKKNGTERIFIEFTNGWEKEFLFGSKVDFVFIVRDLRKRGFTQRLIADVLGVSYTTVRDVK